MTPNDLKESSFNQWLAKQDPGREFNYVEPSGCLLASWLKEEKILSTPLCGNDNVTYQGGLGCRVTIDFPDWMQHVSNRLVKLPTIFTIQQVRESCVA